MARTKQSSRKVTGGKKLLAQKRLAEIAGKLLKNQKPRPAAGRTVDGKKKGRKLTLTQICYRIRYAQKNSHKESVFKVTGMRRMIVNIVSEMRNNMRISARFREVIAEVVEKQCVAPIYVYIFR